MDDAPDDDHFHGMPLAHDSHLIVVGQVVI